MATHLVTNCTVSGRVLESIRLRQGLALAARRIGPEEWEIGYGNRSFVHPDTRISPCQAEDLLRNDMQYVEAFIRRAVARPVTDDLYDALCSYLYDAGPKSSAARARLAALHERGGDGFFHDLAGAAAESRFGAHIGRTARFFEVKLSAQ